jgi:hypothetical protein
MLYKSFLSRKLQICQLKSVLYPGVDGHWTFVSVVFAVEVHLFQVLLPGRAVEVESLQTYPHSAENGGLLYNRALLVCQGVY